MPLINIPITILLDQDIMTDQGMIDLTQIQDPNSNLLLIMLNQPLIIMTLKFKTTLHLKFI